MLLREKVIIVHGAGGSVGSRVSKAFAENGAHVVLCGRREEQLAALYDEIRSSGGKAEAQCVNALDTQSVERCVQHVHERHGRLDVSFNLIGLEDRQGTALLDLPLDDFLRPIERAMRSHMVTATAAARIMKRGGVILALIANCSRQPYSGVGGFGVACAAVAALLRQFAVELGPRGLRTACLFSAGSPDSAGVAQVFELHAALAELNQAEFEKRAASGTMLGHLPKLAEVADAAVMYASDLARAMTAVEVNVTCGEIAD